MYTYTSVSVLEMFNAFLDYIKLFVISKIYDLIDFRILFIQWYLSVCIYMSI